jgi:monoamine oxidase
MKMPAFKLFMVYEDAWWNQLQLSSGRSVSDLPIRQTYYFGTDTQDGHSLLMTSYNDAESVSFWKGLKVRGSGVEPSYISENTRARENPRTDTYKASKAMLQRATAQLRDVHGIEVPEPIVACYKDWSEEPFGAGWFLWKAGQRSCEVMPAVRRSWSEENVFVCGDCYSSLQGWVEGALNTAELMLEQHFGLQRPHWLKDAYLGF